MRYKALAAVFLLFAFHALAQNLEVYNPPAPGGTGFGDLFSVILKQSHVNGIAVFLQWSAVDPGMTAAGKAGPCAESTCNWNVIDPTLRAYIGGSFPGGLSSYPNDKLNLIISIGIIPLTNPKKKRRLVSCSA